MDIVPILKRFVPAPLRPPLRKCFTLLRPGALYNARVQDETHAFNGEHVVDTPPILDYWARKYLNPMLSPFGFDNSHQFFQTYLARVCRGVPHRNCAFVSIGAGNCAAEINMAEWLREVGIRNYTFECIDINSQSLERGRLAAEEKGLSHQFSFSNSDVNKWRPRQQYDAILALQYLHHVVKLEKLFDRIREALHPDGYFLTDDMIGRNGHQRWPEALAIVNRLWSELPEKYKYNQRLKRLEKQYDSWDCSREGFETIRSQDILPLLVDRFHFDLFIAFANIIDIFIDRAFGPNFDPENEWDRAFIDRVHALDVEEIESGRVKPTHMLAALTRNPTARTAMYKHLSPQFCIRPPASLIHR